MYAVYNAVYNRGMAIPGRRSTPAPTLRALLAHRELRLRSVIADTALAPGSLDTPVRWVHSTDLLDPTPFLADEVLLLTTGTQFLDDSDPEVFRDYVDRLRVRRVVGIGFGTEVVREGVPKGLIAACAQIGMPLLEVPYDTPFIAVAQAGAAAIAAQTYARQTWALDAQRAIALAALSSDGLAASVAALSRELGCWAGLFDAGGNTVTAHPPGGVSDSEQVELERAVAAALRRGAAGGSAFSLNGRRFALQTIGRGTALRGVLAVATSETDVPTRGVITSVVAMIGLALEQQQWEHSLRGRLRSATIEALLTDDPMVADRVTRAMWGGMPPPPVTVVVAVADAAGATGMQWWESHARRDEASVLFGRHEDLLVAVCPVDSDLPTRFTTRFEVEAGLSAPAQYSGFSQALAQARFAHSRGVGRIRRFEDAAAAGLAEALTTPDIRAVSASLLDPLLRRDDPTLLMTLRTWLEQECSHERTAEALGIHRHTVRARVATIGELLGLDLDAFSVRASVWVALTALEGTVTTPR